jgi:hypothetical protein
MLCFVENKHGGVVLLEAESFPNIHDLQGCSETCGAEAV